MKTYFTLLLIGSSLFLNAQGNSVKEIKLYRENYVIKHEVVTGEDKKYFRFFPVNNKFILQADFVRIVDTTGFLMKTSGVKTPRYFKYGILFFKVNSTPLQLTVLQGEQTKATEEYKDYLFIPYTDLTSGDESYGGGKYIELNIQDIVDNRILLDFNKAYNPYCAYASGYNCPVPPRENFLNIKIKAGEKKYKKPVE